MGLPAYDKHLPAVLAAFIAMILAFPAPAVQAGPLRDRFGGRLVPPDDVRAPSGNLDADDSDNIDNIETEAQAAVSDGLQVVRDIAYGSDDAQRFDVYLPRGTSLRNAPVLFMVHGGGWRHGDKAMKSVVENKARHWVRKGYVFISTNYRLLPEAAPLAQAEDVARALGVAQRRAASWGGDPSRFVVMGHSAGAHLVALLAAAPENAVRLGAQPWLGTVMLDSAALDVVQVMEQRHARLYDKAFGSDPQAWRRASPYHQLSQGAAPMLVVCSTRRAAACAQARHFSARAATLGIRTSVLPQDLSHREINLLLGAPGGYTSAVDGFLHSVLEQR